MAASMPDILAHPLVVSAMRRWERLASWCAPEQSTLRGITWGEPVLLFDDNPGSNCSQECDKAVSE
eukprot:6213972-Amphidinium_carterae.1